MTDGNKGSTIFLSVIGIATLLVAIVGATFAWFSATVTGNDTASSVTVKAATLNITFTDTAELTGVNITPGWTDNKEFTVVNPAGDNAVAVTYAISWDTLTNTFVNTSDLTYVITSTGTGAGTLPSTAVPTAAGTIIDNITIEPGVTHTYTLTMTYANTDTNQNSDQGKSLAGKLKVVAKNQSAA